MRTLLIIFLSVGIQTSLFSSEAAPIIRNGGFELSDTADLVAPKHWKILYNSHLVLGTKSINPDEAAEGKSYLGMKICTRESTLPIVYQSFILPKGCEKITIKGKTRIFVAGTNALLRLRTTGKIGDQIQYYAGAAWENLLDFPERFAFSKNEEDHYKLYRQGDLTKIMNYHSSEFPFTDGQWQAFTLEVPLLSTTSDYTLELGMAGKATGETLEASVGWDEIDISTN